MSVRVDRTGKIYGRWFVIKFSHLNKANRALWLCRCECGNTSIVDTRSLGSGRSTQCQPCARVAQGLAMMKPKGWFGKARYLVQYKANATRRELVWLLSDTEALQLSQLNCFYCGIKPLGVWGSGCRNTSLLAKQNGLYLANGIDRKNNDLGYTLANCVACCRECNKAKNNTDYDQFMSWIGRLIVFQSKGVL